MSFSCEEYIDGADASSSISETSTRNSFSFQANESLLSISYHESKIGVAYYLLGSTKIQLLHEMYEFNDFTVIRKVLNKFFPTNVVVSSKCDPKLYKLLKKYSSYPNQSFEVDTGSDIEDNELTNDTNNEKNETSFPNSIVIEGDTTLNINSNSFRLQVVSSRLFHYDICKTRILSVDFPKISNVSDKTERFIYLSSYIDFFETNTIKALGVMLQFIEKQLVMQKPTSDFHLDILSELVYFDLDYFVSIDQLTFEALDIFQNEWHPSVSQKGFVKKEGFALYGLFNSCGSKIGSHYLRRLFLQPLSNSTVLGERLDIIEFFTKPDNSNLKDTIYHFLKSIKDISAVVKRLKSMNFTTADFKLLKQTTVSVIAIRNLVSSNSMISSNIKLKIFERIKRCFKKDLNEINECLEKTIDFQKSKQDGKVMIKKGIDDELDKLKFYFNKLPDILKIVINKEDFVNDLIQKHGLHITVIYLPQLGFLLKLSLVEAQTISDISKYGFDLIFCAKDSAYYKNSKTIEFDKIFGDILSEINDRTQQILMLIKDYILKRIKTLSFAVDCCAFLDAMIAIAQTSIEYGFIRPNLTCNGSIKIHQGRHPLYELITKSFVPNDYYSDNNLCKTLVVFGSNGCGKTVYLKQVCSIVYLAHIGSFVPAKFAEISIVDKIFTRIRTPESISTQLSSFKHDLNQMIAATKYAKSRSLVVIDLFGKSTLHSDGFALLEGCLNYWISSENQPHLIMSTKLKIISQSEIRKIVQCYSFENTGGERGFKLKPFQELDEIANNHEVVPELVEINNIIKSDDMTKLVDQLESKQKSFLELADQVLNDNHLEMINQFVLNIE